MAHEEPVSHAWELARDPMFVPSSGPAREVIVLQITPTLVKTQRSDSMTHPENTWWIQGTFASVCLVTFLIFTLSAVSVAQDPPSAKPAAVTNDAQFHDALKRAARDYLTWRRVMDNPRFGPVNCAPPSSGPRIQMSTVKGSQGHGQKLYFLYTTHARAYGHASPVKHVPEGMVLVKETWTPVKVPKADAPDRACDPWWRPEENQAGTYSPYHCEAGTGGSPDQVNIWKAEGQASLFVMIKQSPETPGTDQGWVYATVNREGTVTSSGRVSSCMQCHTRAGEDRLFGRPKKR